MPADALGIQTEAKGLQQTGAAHARGYPKEVGGRSSDGIPARRRFATEPPISITLARGGFLATYTFVLCL
jgi:hypothetical protein